MASISNILQSANPYENFVQQLVQLESQKKIQFQVQQNEHQDRKAALGKVSSSISEFVSKLDELEDPSNKAFQPFSSSVSNEEAVRVNSVSGIDRPSDYDLTIHRLATNDTALSQVTTGGGTDLSGFGDGSVDITIGDKTETVSVATTKTDDTGATVNKTNEEIYQSFADEISNLFGDEAQATVFQVSSENVQLSVQSLETGFENRIQMNGASGVLAEITGGMAHQTDTPEELDAEFTIDGVTFTRAQNNVEDAIDGLSFTLLKETGEAEQMSVTRDLEKARENVDGFMDAFNNLNKTIRDQTYLNAETGNRGKLQSMRSIRNLTMDLRQTAMLSMDGAAAGELASLTELGIGFENDGTMKIEDEELLEKALAERPQEVTNFFTSESSPVATMKIKAETYTDKEGVIASLESGIDQKIDFLDNRIESENRYLEKYEERQRTMFAELQQIEQRGQQQYDRVMSIQASMGYY